FNLKGQYPGIGNIWLSLFVDEINVMGNWRELDRAMMAGQAGINIALPFLAFSSIVMSYTKVNPYCYTHNRNFTPWYSDVAMETSYTNNGRSLGHYLPPNSDEIMFRFKTMPAKGLGTHLQYQMIRHGASYGSSEVDGSSLVSELGPVRHGPDLVLKRFFLKDGAYQWQHIIKIGAEWKIPKIPVSLFGEAGAVISYFTNIKEPANITGKAHPYSKIDTAEYPKSTGFVVRFGVNVFPR
ncbi:MAG: hypothetical protein FWH41_06485, partial [Treponema sp.]|nr:hypothetical protein [Treponema sp.]